MRSLSRSILNIGVSLLSLLALGKSAKAADCPSSCPTATSSVIEALNEARSFTDRGTTSGKSNRCSYNSPKCTIATARFIGPEQVYKVVLHKDNYIRFSLSFPKDKCRLIMVLTATDKGCTCEKHSQGDLGGSLETFEGHFAEGTYYLYVDSIDPTSCPQYTLTATGFNPTPDLVLDLVAPSSVYAGGELKYALSLRNAGNLDATAVRVTQPILPGTQYRSSNGCGQEGNTVVCKFDRLGVSQSAPGRTLTFAVDPATRGKLVASARAEATEGDPTSPNVDSATINIDTKVNLSIQHNFPASFNAGTTLSYNLTLSNTELSDATKVVLTNKLSPGLTFTKVPTGCSNLGNTSVCDKIQRIRAHSNDTILPFIVKSTPSVFGKLSQDISVKADEVKPGPVSTTIKTEARRLANLTITMEKPTPAIQAAGEKITYKITVENKGPSDSAKAMVTDDLPPGLTFLGSSSNCSAAENKASVTCEILGIPSGGKKTVTFDARIDSSLDETKLVNRAMVQAKDNSTDPVVTSKPVEAQVFVQADMLAQTPKVERLSWTFPPTPGGVKAGENLLYTVSAVNSGPSDFHGGELQDELPAGLTFVSSPDGCSVTNRTVTCSVPVLKKGDNAVRRFVVGIIPSKTGAVDNSACVNSRFKAHDPQEKNNCANISTKVETEADLSLTLSDSPDAVRPGEELTYKVNVKNEGPSDASGVVVGLGDTSIELDDVAAGAVKSRPHSILAPAEPGVLSAEARVSADTVDLNEDNDFAETSTTVANPEDTDLAVRLSVDAEAAVAGRSLTYKVTLTNQGLSASGETDVSVSFPQEASISPTDCCRFDALAPGVSQTRALTVDVGSELTGSLLATADIVQADTLNPTNNSSSIEIPVVQPTKNTELCASWSVRFFRGQPAGTSTDLLFFVPNLPDGIVATGRVFTEAGDFLQTVSVSSDKEEFRRPTLSLLAGAGSIEWTLRKGLVGSGSSIHKRDGAEIPIPGFCRRPGHIGAKALMLRSFQVDSAVNTFVAIRNETDEEVEARITYSSESAEPRQQTIRIAGHGVATRNLRAELASWDGSLEISAFSKGQPIEALSGDFIRIGRDGLSGAALDRKPD